MQRGSDVWRFPLVSTNRSTKSLCVPAIFVASSQQLIETIIARAKGLKVDGGFERGADM